jgi:uncharacterized protein with WD repeat
VRLVATGEVIWSCVSRSTGGGSAASWNPCVWTADERYVARIGKDTLTLVDAATMRTVAASVPARGVAPGQVWVGPQTAAPYVVATFHPRAASRPASVTLWRAGVTGGEAVVGSSKSLEADTCSVTFSPNGTHALAILRTDTSASSY